MNRAFVYIFVIYFFTACGGGTSGTSSTGIRTQKIVAGNVKTEDQQSVQGATVEVNNNSANTDSNGRFALATEIGTEKNVLKLTSNIVSRNVELPLFSNLVSYVNLSVNVSKEEILVKNLELTLNSISGDDCENAFSELKIVKLNKGSTPLLLTNQLSNLQKSTKCFAKLQVFSNGAPVQGINLEMYFIPTDNLFEKEIFLGTKGTDHNGQAQFEFMPNFKKDGFFVVEAPNTEDREFRAALVINVRKKL